MNNIIRRFALSILFFAVTLPMARPGYTDDMTTTAEGSSDATEALQDIKLYLYNLGSDLGYILTNPIDAPTNTLLGANDEAPTAARSTAALELIALRAVATMFGAIPVNASLLDPTLLNFVPSAFTAYNAFNAFANATFTSYNNQSGPQNTPGMSDTNQGMLSTSPLIDQQVNQQDPVSQSILNILGTPDYTYCMDITDTSWVNSNSQTLGDCPLLYQNKVMSNVIGPLPLTPYLDPGASQQIISQLNSNSLTGPLLYTTNTTGAPSPAGSSGLTATTQAQQAANFIRYASGAVIPLSLASQVEYRRQLGLAKNPSNDRTTRENAQAVLTKYLAKIRVYAAQRSVAVSNLYHILSKRMPQTLADKNGSSEAMAEFEMATRRIYDPAAVAAGNPQWIARINTASPATVQKEMALLLSEINYQLYLSRQQNERLLLTNSLLLIQNLDQTAPDPALSSNAP